MRPGLAAANPPWPGGFAFAGRLRRRACTAGRSPAVSSPIGRLGARPVLPGGAQGAQRPCFGAFRALTVSSEGLFVWQPRFVPHACEAGLLRPGLAAANPPWPGGFAFAGRLRRRACTAGRGPAVSSPSATSEPGLSYRVSPRARSARAWPRWVLTCPRTCPARRAAARCKCARPRADLRVESARKRPTPRLTQFPSPHSSETFRARGPKLGKPRSSESPEARKALKLGKPCEA